MWKTTLIPLLLLTSLAVASSPQPTTAKAKTAPAPKSLEFQVTLQQVGATWVPVLKVIFRTLKEAADGTEIGNGYKTQFVPPLQHMGSESHGRSRIDLNRRQSVRIPVNPYFDPIS